LKESGRIGFHSLFEGIESRPALIATFLALLEMIKLEIVQADTEDEEILITQIRDGDISHEQQLKRNN
jgi:chromatin segregation and condensation protein Rec8/ScpA/Scc1 (kleisin family)